MNKIGMFLLSILLLPSLSFAFSNEPDGFNGLKWGTSFTEVKNVMEFTEEDDGVKFYSRRADELSIGKNKVTNIQYGFWQNKYYTVRVSFNGSDSAASIKSYLFAKYGDGKEDSSHNENAEIYSWGGAKTWIKYKYIDQTKNGHVLFTSSPTLKKRIAQKIEQDSGIRIKIK